MKIAAICLLLSVFIQVFCEKPTVNRASETPTPKIAGENNMSENNDSDALRQICQLTLDLPKIQPYLHPEIKERNPLKVLKNAAVKDKIALTKFDKPVEFVEKSEAEKNNAPVFEFTKIDIAGKTATVEFNYAVEGIRGKAELKMTDKWEVVSATLSES